MSVAVLGSVDDKAHKDLITKIIEQFDFYAKQLDPIKNVMSRYNRLYLGERKDVRRENEKWRSNTWLGDPFLHTETETAVWISLLNSQVPSVTAEGVGTEDEWKARGFTRAIDYFQRKNRWTYQQEQICRKVSFQGWTIIEPRWREITFQAIMPPTKQQRVAYDQSVGKAMMQGMPEPPNPMQDPQGSELWHQQTNIQPVGIGPRDVVQYRGPWWNNSSDYDYYFDPFLEDWTEQELLIKRVVKPWAWLEKEAKKGKYDPDNLAKCKGKGGGEDDKRLSKWEREIAARQGLTFNEQDPIYQNAAEILEVWRVKDELPYLVICNRTGVINVRPDVHPYWHRQLPFVPIRNIPLHGRALGSSSYAQLEKAFADRLKFRDLLFDMMIISVMPVLLKKRGMGLTDMQKAFQPGMILDVNDPGGLQRAWESPAGFAELVQITQMILNDQSLLLATGENVRGQQATVGRVSATEAQSRLSQALVRHTQRAIRLEEEFNPIIPQALALVAQFWPTDDAELSKLRAKMVGQDEQDPWVVPPGEEFTKNTFAEALEMDLKFTGASRTKDLQLAAQQLKDFTQFGASIQVAPGVPALSGTEIRNLLRRMYRTLGQKGTEEALTQEGDQIVAQSVQLSLTNAIKGMQLQGAQTDQQLEALQNPPQPEQPPGPEATIVYRDTPPDVKRQLEQRAGLQPSQMGELEVAEKMVKAQPRPMPERGPQRG